MPPVRTGTLPHGAQRWLQTRSQHLSPDSHYGRPAVAVERNPSPSLDWFTITGGTCTRMPSSLLAGCSEALRPLPNQEKEGRRMEEDGGRGAKQSPKVMDVPPLSDLRLDVSVHIATRSLLSCLFLTEPVTLATARQDSWKWGPGGRRRGSVPGAT